MIVFTLHSHCKGVTYFTCNNSRLCCIVKPWLKVYHTLVFCCQLEKWTFSLILPSQSLLSPASRHKMKMALPLFLHHSFPGQKDWDRPPPNLATNQQICRFWWILRKSYLHNIELSKATNWIRTWGLKPYCWTGLEHPCSTSNQNPTNSPENIQGVFFSWRPPKNFQVQKTL